MSISNITSSIAATTGYSGYTSTAKAKTEKEDTKEKISEGAVYEKSSEEKTDSAKSTYTKESVDRSALIEKMKADTDSRVAQLKSIVEKIISGQGNTLAKADDMWKFLANGDFTVDEATKKQAQADIAEDGYWGADKTSDRILDFAKALSGGDKDKADELLDAFKKGYEEATKTWGKELPSLSKDTYDLVEKKFEAWKNETE